MTIPQSVHTTRLALIGHICIQWSNLEYQVAQCIWFILGLNRETGKIVTGGLDMLPRLNMSINLARHLKADKRLISQLVATRAAVQDKLDTRRNRAVHGVHFSVDGEGAMVEVHRGKGGREAKLLEDKELISLGREINLLSNALLAKLGPLLEARAKQ